MCEKCGGCGEIPVPGSYFMGGPVMLPCECRRFVASEADEALFAFDAENNVEPFITIAQRVAGKYGIRPSHSLVDDIIGALEDAYSLGERRGPLARTNTK